MLSTEYIVKELINVLNLYENGKESITNQGQSLDGYSALANFVGLIKQLREIEYVKSKSV